MIAYLKNEDAEMNWKHNEKESILHQHFLGVLGSKVERRHTLDWESLGLSRIDGRAIDQPFTLEELKHTVDELPAEKGPRAKWLHWPFLQEVLGHHQLQFAGGHEQLPRDAGSPNETSKWSQYYCPYPQIIQCGIPKRLQANQSNTLFWKIRDQNFGHPHGAFH